MAYDGRLLRLAQERYEADRHPAGGGACRPAGGNLCPPPPAAGNSGAAAPHGQPRDGRRAAAGTGPAAGDRAAAGRKISACRRSGGSFYRSWDCPEDALEDTPACPLCGDTGFRGGELCRCLKTYYVEEQRRELSRLLDLGGQSFDTFDTDWYDGQRAPGKSKSAREHMEWVYDTCVEYAHNFGKKPANLLLFGRPGLGKTHLSAAIAREVSGKGFSVVYDTAGHVFERFEAQKFGRDEADGMWSGSWAATS